MPKKYILIYDVEQEGYMIGKYVTMDVPVFGEVTTFIAIEDYVYEDVEEAAKELVQLERLVEGEHLDRGGV